MEKSLKYIFANGSTAKAIHVNASTDLAIALNQIGLSPPRPMIVLVGGASGLDESALNRLRSLFVKGLTPEAEALGVAVVDGGTDAGVMQLIGQARAEIRATFPLIGVAVADKVAAPEMIASHPQATALEPHHTHFILVPGTKWGDESPWLAQVADVLSGGSPSITVLVNGGEIAWQDVAESISVGRPVLVIGGSGRTADVLAGALRGQATDARADELVASGLLHAIDVTEGFDALARTLQSMLAPKV